MSDMKLSVIVPIYNAEEYLESCLRSLNALRDEFYEFILVNDGSRDNSLGICFKYRNLDSRFIVVDKNNGGVSSARNAGLNIAKGKYIYFLDSDDLVSDCIFQAVLYCDLYDIDYLVLRRFYLTRKCGEFKYNLEDENFENINNQLYLIVDPVKLMLTKFCVSGSGEALFKSSSIHGIRFNENLSLLEDFDFFFMLFYTNIKRIFFYNEIVTYINDDNLNSLTKKKEEISDLSSGSLLGNPFLQLHNKLSRKVIWLEIYFHYKKITFKNRWKYLFKYHSIMLNNLLFCKYTIGCIGLLVVNLDINRIREICRHLQGVHKKN